MSLWSILLVMAAVCGLAGCQATNSSPASTAPTITSLTPSDGAVGTSVTIAGSNFGSSQGTSTVTFNGIAATATTWSATSIATTVPTGATTGNVIVTVNSVASNGENFVVPAIITSLSATSGAVGSSLIITGSNFGSSQGSSTVTFGGVSAGTATAWSATSITVTVPVGATTGNVVVTVSSVASNGEPFTPGPSITNLSATSGQVGTSITITGVNFGATQGSSTVTFNTALATPTSWTASSIVVPVPVGATTGNIVVKVGTLSSNGSPFTVLVPPQITNLSSSSGAVGTAITITGTNFGATQGTSTVTFNNTSAGTATSWSATSIVVNVPVGATPGNVVVTVSTLASNGVAFTPGPSITSLSTGTAAVGTSITVTGVGFGATQGGSTITFNGLAASPTSWSNTSIAVPVPSGATAGNIVVTVGGFASNGQAFTPGPTITSLSTTSTFVNATITINGDSFGATQGSSTVTFNGTTASTIVSWSATAIQVIVPIGATTGNVVVTVSGLASNGSPFTPGPSITGVNPTAAPVGNPITISGTQFGATQGSSVVNIGGVVAGTAASWSNTSITINVPSGATTGGIVVSVNSLPSNTEAFTVGTLTFMPDCANSPTGDESKLNGSYVFLVQGFVGTGNGTPVATIISFQANGSGIITGGEGDTNGGGLTSEQHYNIEPTSSSGYKYTVGKDPTSSGDIGCVALTNVTSGTTATFWFSLGMAVSNVYTKGRLIRFDDATGTGTRGAGILLEQTAPFSFPLTSNNFAFGENGWNSSNDPFEGGGFVTVSSTGSFTNLSADFDLEGTINYGLGAGSPILGVTNNNGGFNAAADADGYTTITDNYTVSSTTETFHYAAYFVNSHEVFFLSTDAITSTTPLAAGRALETFASFTSSSLTGAYIIHQTGTAVSGSQRTAEISLGLLSFTPGTGAVTGTVYQYESGGTATSLSPSATYTVNASTGRVALVDSSNPSGFGTNSNVPVFYIAGSQTADPISAFAIGTDADSTFGFLEASAGSGFSNGSLTGNWFFGNEAPGDNTVVDGIGVVDVSGGTGSCVGTQYLSGPSGSSAVGLTEQNLSPCQVNITNTNGFGNIGTNSVFLTNGQVNAVGQSFYYFDDSSGSTAEIIAGDAQ